MDPSAVSARLIGMMFVERGLITEEQLDHALELQRTTGDRLGEILVEQFGVQRLDLASALAEQWAEYEREGTVEELTAHAENRDLVAVSDEWRGGEPAATSGKRPIGEIFVERGLISASQLEDALDEQKNSGRRLGEILVATGRLTRLELASALADQWASFQKLRPPSDDAPGGIPIMPTPEGVAPSMTSAAAAELTSRLDELAVRVDELAAAGDGESAYLGDEADALRARIDQLEAALSTYEPASVDELRRQLAEVAARIDVIPAPDAAWRSDLAEVAENLRTRVERVEKGLEVAPGSSELEVLRGSLEALGARIDAQPEPSEEWRPELAELRAMLAELRDRLEATPAPSEAWRDDVASLRDRVEQLAAETRDTSGADELRGSLEALIARFDSLPGPSEEWREPVAELRARLDALPRNEWRPELAEVAENLRTRLERAELGLAGASDSSELEVLRGSLDALAARLDALPAPSEEWRSELAVVAENLRTRLERVEQGLDGASRSSELVELRGSLEALAAHVDALPALSDEWRLELAGVAESLRTRLERVEQGLAGASGSSELEVLRGSLEALAAQVDALPAPSDEWRLELAGVAENLRTRLERVEQGLAGASGSSELEVLRASLEALAVRVDAVPSPAEEWRAPLSALAARLDTLAAPSEEWRDALSALAARVDTLPDTSSEWRAEIAALAGRLDSLGADEWRTQLADVADDLRGRIDFVGRAADGSQTEGLDAIRADFDSLTAKVDALPATLDTFRSELAELRHVMHERVEQADRRLADAVDGDALEALRARVDEIAVRVDEHAGSESHLRESLSALIAERIAGATEETSDLRTRLDDVSGKLDGVAEVAGRIDDAERRIGEAIEAAGSFGPQADELKETTERLSRRAEELGRRVDELATRRDPGEIEQALAQRLAATEDALAGLHGSVHELNGSVEERFAAAEQRADVVARATADVESLRHGLDELRSGVDAARSSVPERVDAVASALREELETTAVRVVDGAVAELRSTVDAHAAQLQSVADEIVSTERRLDEKSAARSADLSALRARLESVESSLAGTSGWNEAVDGTNARLESLELHLVESFASEAVERDAQIRALQAEVSERAEALERAQAEHEDVRDLRDAIDRVARRLDERSAQDDATGRAVEEALREGLAVLGEQLTASEETYMTAGRSLRRSIDTLAGVISGADAHLTLDETNGAEPASYVAFAPTPEGYRLFVCAGGTPGLGGFVELPECEGALVVTRVGVSPLPFDSRPCVYLDPVA